ncbi:FUSC family protein [Microbacterium sp. Sa4CUA7]|uniref:FUSC family protein n=1 Tax=Microbacterium pullorum TaxID=2762236 RepID=A0ABR8S4T8_9MICO|nr:FUSC family protein [Microbacterium pullorum]MBD7958506.1 FUSC family protein [Microbacterium pullorum]
MSPSPRGALRRPAVVATLRSAGSEVVALSRLLLAVKTAVAAALAWYLAPYVPFASAEYSYYAPMGVLVSMYPTVADSARAGFQAIVGLGLGILLGFGGLVALTVGAPGIVAIALVIGVGVALGGIRRLGEGREWIALAGLFVLVLGGRDADEFSTSYIVTMAFGVLVGVAANYVLLPPLYLREAGAQLAQLRDRIAQSLQQTADLIDEGDLDADRLGRDADDLAALSVSVAEGVREAGRSVRGNPRGRHRAAEQEQNRRAWSALERSVLLVRELMEMLMQYPDVARGASDRSTVALAEAVRACGVLMATPESEPEAAECLDEASRAVTRYAQLVAAGAQNAPAFSPELAVAGYLGRLVQLCRRSQYP